MSSSIFEQVRQVASDLFAVPAQELTAASSPDTIEAWDSTQHLTLVLALEERFNFQLAPEEIEEMHNLGNVVRVIETKLQAEKQ